MNNAQKNFQEFISQEHVKDLEREIEKQQAALTLADSLIEGLYAEYMNTRPSGEGCDWVMEKISEWRKLEVI